MAGRPAPDGAAGGTDALARAHQQLREAVAALAETGGWRQLLTLAARLPRYSANNLLLIGAQRPEASLVAGYHRWRQLGRQVRRGERGIAILAPLVARVPAADQPGPAQEGPEPAGAEPDGDREVARALRGFRVVRVFDVSQTDGPPLPRPAPPVLLPGQAPPGLWDALAGQVGAAGFSLRRADCAPANGSTDFPARRVSVHTGLPAAQAVKTLAHELAHVLLHDPAAPGPPPARTQAEVEAESVAFLVTRAHGLDAADYSAPYLAGWSGGDSEQLLRTATRVLDTARQVLAAAPPATDPAAAEPADRAAGRRPPLLTAAGRERGLAR